MFFHSIRFKVYKLAVGRQPFLFQIRSCFKIIPRQIETYVEADWSPRYVVNSGLLTKIKEFKMRDRGAICAGTYLLAMIILFLYKFKTAS